MQETLKQCLEISSLDMGNFGKLVGGYLYSTKSSFDCWILDEDDEVSSEMKWVEMKKKMFDFSFNLQEHVIPWTSNMGKENEISLSLSLCTDLLCHQAFGSNLKTQ